VDANNMYWGGVINRNGTAVAEIWRMVGGVWTLLGGGSAGTGLGRLRFEAVGSSLRLYLTSGQVTTLVAVAGDSALSAGSAGLYSSAGTRFDNFAVNPVALQPASLPHQENFDAANGTGLGLTWREHQGTFVVSGNELHGLGGLNIATLNGVSQRDTRVEALVTSIPRDASLAFMSRFGDTNNMYWAGLINRGGSYVAEIWRKAGGAWTLLKAQSAGTALGTLAFETNGPFLRLFLNGRVVAAATDHVLTTGSVGVYAGQGVRLDNFRAEVFTPPALPFGDSFDQTNTTLGTSWFEAQGDFKVENGQLRINNVTSLAVLAGLAAQRVSVEANVVSIADGTSAALVTRYQGATGNMFWGGLVRRGNSYFAEIWRRDNGVWTALARSSTALAPLGATVGMLRFDMAGTSLGLFLNGELIAFALAQDALSVTGTVGLYGSAGTAFDSFTARAL
jgi:hypothetical protein